MTTETITDPLATIPAWTAWYAQDNCGPAGSAYARWVLAPESEGDTAGLWLVCEGWDAIGEGRDWLTKRRPTGEERAGFLAHVLPRGTDRTWAAEKNQAKFRRARVTEVGSFGAADRQVWR